MQKDIRDLLKETHFPAKKLPEKHREEFIQKLKASQKSRKKWLPTVLKIAAAIALLFSSSYTIIHEINNKDEVLQQTALNKQLKEIEAQYLKAINREWNNFLTLTSDSLLINRYDKKLTELQTDYLDISEQYIQDTKNILVIEALIENLQTRLDLLKDIQEHIQLLNQQNEQHETTI